MPKLEFRFDRRSLPLRTANYSLNILSSRQRRGRYGQRDSAPQINEGLHRLNPDSWPLVTVSLYIKRAHPSSRRTEPFGMKSC